MRKIFFILSAVLIFAGDFYPQMKKDFLVVEFPAALSINNKYRQTLSQAELNRLKENSPFQILREDSYYEDGFRKYMLAELDGNTFYLDKDEKGRLIGIERGGVHKVLRNCIIKDDTIKILRSDIISLQYFESGKKILLEEGDLTERIFSFRGKYYVKVLTQNNIYGWVNFDAYSGANWRKLEYIKKEKVFDEVTSNRIAELFEEVNRKYSSIYKYLNELSGNNNSPPVWTVEIKGSEIICTLSGISNENNLNESFRYIENKLEGILIKYSADIKISGSRIYIGI